MRVDEIQDIIKKYEELPYECIMIDGPWGVGKSYAISKALEEKKY